MAVNASTTSVPVRDSGTPRSTATRDFSNEQFDDNSNAVFSAYETDLPVTIDPGNFQYLFITVPFSINNLPQIDGYADVFWDATLGAQDVTLTCAIVPHDTPFAGLDVQVDKIGMPIQGGPVNFGLHCNEGLPYPGNLSAYPSGLWDVYLVVYVGAGLPPVELRTLNFSVRRGTFGRYS